MNNKEIDKLLPDVNAQLNKLHGIVKNALKPDEFIKPNPLNPPLETLSRGQSFFLTRQGLVEAGIL